MKRGEVHVRFIDRRIAFLDRPRYRRKVLKGDVAEQLDELIREICRVRDWEVEALTVQRDHVHLFVEYPPRDAPAKVMRVTKSITARELYSEYPQLRRTHWGSKLWADRLLCGFCWKTCDVGSDQAIHRIKRMKLW